MKTLGVIGGMGPAATVAFLARLQVLTPAARDEDHIRVLADIHPRIPNRHAEPQAAGEAIGRIAARLAETGAEVLAMPCNTAHAHAAHIRAAGLPFIDMIAETVEAVRAAGGRRVGVLATPGGEALYVQALTDAGMTPVTLEGEDRAAFMTSIFGVKGGETERSRATMIRLAKVLETAGADHLIGGCTEVPLLLKAEDAGVPLTDSAEVLAAACVRACT
ncbi:MAG: amino acid racemase [Caulobacterales bacterium]|nr:amino acid racemase [Caulobacterales bacterium]